MQHVAMTKCRKSAYAKHVSVDAPATRASVISAYDSVCHIIIIII